MKKNIQIIKLLGKVIAFTFIFLFANNSFSQTRKDVEKKKEKNEKEIQYINKLISETQKTKKSTLNQLTLINEKINVRKSLIQNINNDIGTTSLQINEYENVIKEMENDLKVLKEEYSKMIQYAYKNRNSYHKLMFIFSSDDFNQAYKRLKYLQSYSEYRQKQAELIVLTKESLEKKVIELEIKKNTFNNLLNKKQEEKRQLDVESSEKDKVIQELKGKENELRKKLEQKRQTSIALQAELERIIEEEIRKAKEKAGKPNSSGAIPLSPKEKKLAEDFISNKGKLPWPTERGLITSYFGTHAHKKLKNIQVKNNGVDILTNNGMQARAIFSGEVTSIIIIPGANKTVIVKHGNYYTVYSNLKDVFVKKGDMVTTKQPLGIVFTDEEGSTELHFELWQDKSPQNPQNWILSK